MPDPSLLRVVVFDGDDTLWRTMPLYSEAKGRFFGLMRRLIPDAVDLERDFEHRDHRNVGRWGFTVERFRNSMVETYDAWASARGIPRELRLEAQISRIATSVAKRRAPLLPHAKATLTRLNKVARLVLVTKGEYELQQQRLSRSGLEPFFERVLIVGHKDRGTFRQLSRELHVKPSSMWSVGDSLRSDIRPALAAGLHAIWIPQKTWSYEEASPSPPNSPRFITIPTIRDLPKVLVPALKKDNP